MPCLGFGISFLCYQYLEPIKRGLPTNVRWCVKHAGIEIYETGTFSTFHDHRLLFSGLLGIEHYSRIGFDEVPSCHVGYCY